MVAGLDEMSCVGREYAKQDLGLAAHAKVAGVYNAALLGVSVAACRSRALPERIAPYDLLVIGLATHKISRLFSKDRFNAPLRAPFVEYRGEAGAGEVDEAPRGGGMRRTLGLLISEPACTGPWVAPLLALGLVRSPRSTRLVGSIFAAIAISDFLHRGYDVLKTKSR
jgi:hypothetical protein